MDIEFEVMVANSVRVGVPKHWMAMVGRWKRMSFSGALFECQSFRGWSCFVLSIKSNN